MPRVANTAHGLNAKKLVLWPFFTTHAHNAKVPSLFTLIANKLSVFSSFLDFLAGPIADNQIVVPAVDVQVFDSGCEPVQSPQYCTASGSEPAWHNGFGVEQDFTTMSDPFGNDFGGGSFGSDF